LISVKTADQIRSNLARIWSVLFDSAHTGDLVRELMVVGGVVGKVA
jgi:hypothetical protein